MCHEATKRVSEPLTIIACMQIPHLDICNSDYRKGYDATRPVYRRYSIIGMPVRGNISIYMYITLHTRERNRCVCVLACTIKLRTHLLSHLALLPWPVTQPTCRDKKCRRCSVTPRSLLGSGLGHFSNKANELVWLDVISERSRVEIYFNERAISWLICRMR